MLPSVEDEASYRRWREGASLRAPLEAICRRQRLDAGRLEVSGEGTHVVGVCGPVVIKLYAPCWRDAAVEREVLLRLEGRLPVATPILLAEGRLDGWRYVVMTRLEGDSLEARWSGLDGYARARVMRELGEVLDALHEVPVGGLEAADIGWERHMRARRRRVASRQRAWGLPHRLSVALTGWIDGARLPPLVDEGPQAAIAKVLLHGDLTAGQVLMGEDAAGRLTVRGLIDFGDALVGHAEYDLVSPALYIARGDATLQQALLRGYGLDRAALLPSLARRLLAWTALHEHGDIAWLLDTRLGVDPEGVRDLDVLLRWLFPGAGAR